MNTLKEGGYLTLISEALRPKTGQRGTVLDLFAGCGGLALGFESAGFETIGFEADSDCCSTYRKNLKGECYEVFLNSQFKFPNADIVIGGPPCQPFSVGGNQQGVKDTRNGFPAFVSAISQVRPKLWMFENVRGLLYRNKSYFDSILGELEDLGYAVEHRLLNAVDYFVPQNRERMIVVGHKGGFEFPKPKARRVTSGEALGELAISAPVDGKYLTPNQDKYIAKYERASSCVNPRDLALKRPARTLTCRNLAGATGDMQRLKLPDGRRRRLLIREAARLQSFPDWFEFCGKETSQYNQIGNAVSPMFSYALAQACSDYLSMSEPLSAVEIKLFQERGQTSFSF